MMCMMFVNVAVLSFILVMMNRCQVKSHFMLLNLHHKCSIDTNTSGVRLAQSYSIASIGFCL